RMIDDDARRRGGQTPTALRAGLRSRVGSEHCPPATQPWWMLSETMLHGQDIRRGLGMQRDFPADRLIAVLDQLAPRNAILGVRRRLDGLRLRATDVDWRHGEWGPEVVGSGEALMMAMAGRSAALGDLGGEGAVTLRLRLLSA